MEKINVAKLLKDCPKGMELYSPIFGTVYFEGIRDTGRAILIDVTTSCNTSVQFYSDGKFNTYYSESEVTLFPSKSQRDWSKFQRPFKDGDIVATQGGGWLGITKNETSYGNFNMHCAVNCIYHNEFHTRGEYYFSRFATEEEKEKLFYTIKANGYHWNSETKTLEKMIKDKFDINTLVPFESKVLVRDSKAGRWKPAYWGFYDKTNNVNYPYVIVGGSAFGMSIPYENNEHLLGTTDDCDEFYKTW